MLKYETSNSDIFNRLILSHATKAMVITRARNLELDGIEFHAPSTKVAETSWKIGDTIEGINCSTVLENCNVRKVKTDILWRW